jgi:hypothetical protein
MILNNLPFYLAQHEYEGNFTEVCTKFWCYDATRDGCYYNEAGNGIACGSGSVCLFLERLNAKNSLLLVVDVKYGD